MKRAHAEITPDETSRTSSTGSESTAEEPQLKKPRGPIVTLHKYQPPPSTLAHAHWSDTLNDPLIQEHGPSNLVLARDLRYMEQQRDPTKVFRVMPWAAFFRMWAAMPDTNQHFHECLLDKKHCRFVIDLDAARDECAETVPTLDFFLHHLIEEVILPECIRALNELFSEYGIVLTPADFTLLVACSRLKYSAHLVCHHPMVYFDALRSVRALTAEIAQRCAGIEPASIKEKVGERMSIIDCHLAHALRVFKSGKLDEPQRPLRLYSLETRQLCPGYPAETLRRSLLTYVPPGTTEYYLVRYDQPRVTASDLQLELNPHCHRPLSSGKRQPVTTQSPNTYRLELTKAEQTRSGAAVLRVVRAYYKSLDITLPRSIEVGQLRWNNEGKQVLMIALKNTPCPMNARAHSTHRAKLHPQKTTALMVYLASGCVFQGHCFSTHCIDRVDMPRVYAGFDELQELRGARE